VVSEDRHRAFHQRPVWQRVAVLLAGPAFNFLFAILAYWLMFVTGVVAYRPLVASVEPETVAARAGLEAGDEVTAIGGEATPTWDTGIVQLLDELLDDGRIELTVRGRDGTTRQAELDVRGREQELTEPAALFDGLGLRPGAAAIVGAIVEGSPAARAGLLPGDRVLEADGQAIAGWIQWVDFLRTRPGATVELTVLRGGSERTLTATLESRTENGTTFGRIGASAPQQRYGLLGSVPRAVDQTWDTIAFTVSMIGRMITGEVSLKNVSGPLSIADIAGTTAELGLAYFLNFLAAVSIGLGVLNLLPIPLLDGGNIVFQLAEGIKGAPLSERALALGQQIGIFLVIALTGFAFYNDIVRLFGS
jgi:regulator of sigma E protease